MESENGAPAKRLGSKAVQADTVLSPSPVTSIRLAAALAFKRTPIQSGREMLIAESHLFMNTRGQRQQSTAPVGINLFGYFFAESGVGENARQLVRAIDLAGLQHVAVPYTKTPSRQKHTFVNRKSLRTAFPINLVAVNADEFPRFVRDLGPDFLDDTYTIGIWAWEVEEFPRWMAESQQFVDEIWAISDFSARAIAGSVERPVHVSPVPVSVPDFEQQDRSRLDLPSGFLFYFCFDFDSVFERKNPIAVIEAFRRAFPPDSGPQLVIKSVNGERHGQELDRLREAAGARSDITVIDGYWSQSRRYAAFAACDAYVSLHRAEGFGLTIAEAMALGKPVIATAYSGNLDFMNAENSYLVPWAKARIPVGCQPYPAGGIWAEPDVESAAELMKRVWLHREEAELKAYKARRDMLRHHSPAVRAAFIGKRIREIAADLPGHVTAKPLPILTLQEAPDGGVEPGTDSTDEPSVLEPCTGKKSISIARVAAQIEEGPDLQNKTRLGSFGLLLRRIVIRILRNYDLHQRQVGHSTVLALRDLEDRITDLAAVLEDLDARLTELESRTPRYARDSSPTGNKIQTSSGSRRRPGHTDY